MSGKKSEKDNHLSLCCHDFQVIPGDTFEISVIPVIQQQQKQWKKTLALTKFIHSKQDAVSQEKKHIMDKYDK